MTTMEAHTTARRESVERLRSLRTIIMNPAISTPCRRRNDWESAFRKGDPSADEARAHCHGCPIKRECLEAALIMETDSGTSCGIWGGLSARQRRTIINRRETAELLPSDAEWTWREIRQYLAGYGLEPSRSTWTGWTASGRAPAVHGHRGEFKSRTWLVHEVVAFRIAELARLNSRTRVLM